VITAKVSFTDWAHPGKVRGPQTSNLPPVVVANPAAGADNIKLKPK